MFIAANWKMNCLKADSIKLTNDIGKLNQKKNDVVICPPFTLIDCISKEIAKYNIKLGAQDCHYEEKGAFTGDISPKMLADLGVQYVIIGHSERRSHHNESDEMVKRKALSAIKAKLVPIICIGETHADRKAGKAENIILNQIENSVPKDHLGSFIIAYEPIWAIGTGLTPTSKEIEEMHRLISGKLSKTKILYGGSVNDDNCKKIASISNVSGFLVGGASLDATKFSKIMNV